MKNVGYILLGAFIALVILAVVWGLIGAIFYFGLPVLGYSVSYAQAVVLTVLIATVGRLFFGGLAVTKGED